MKAASYALHFLRQSLDRAPDVFAREHQRDQQVEALIGPEFWRICCKPSNGNPLVLVPRNIPELLAELGYN